LTTPSGSPEDNTTLEKSGSELRGSIEERYTRLMRAYDEAERRPDDESCAALSEATDAMMRALARLIIEMNRRRSG